MRLVLALLLCLGLLGSGCAAPGYDNRVPVENSLVQPDEHLTADMIEVPTPGLRQNGAAHTTTTVQPVEALDPPIVHTPSPALDMPRTNCDPNYSGCVPIASDVDCAGGSGNGPAYVHGPVRVIGYDKYGLDRDSDGVGCE